MIYDVIVLLIILLNKIISSRYKYSLAVGVILVLFAGLRHSSIGPDTSQYEYLFEETQRFGLRNLGFFFISDDNNGEPGYSLLEYICGLIFDYDIFKFLCAAFQTIPAIYIIHKYSKHRCVSYLIYFCLPVYTMMSMSMMRQGIAFSFFLMGYQSILDRNLKKYVLFILIGFLFHSSVLFMLPVYFLYGMNYKRRYNLIIIGLIALFIIISQTIFQYVASYSRMQYEVEGVAGIKMLIFMILCFLSSYFVSEKDINIDPLIKHQLYMLVFTILIWCFAMNTAAVLRLAAYTEFFICLYVSNLLGKISDNTLGTLVRTLICVGCYMVLHIIVMRPSSSDVITYYPYYFLWERP